MSTMYSIFCEAKFWTLKNEVQIKSNDLGAFRYYEKKEIDECMYFEGKKLYCSQRGTAFVLENKRPLKLRDRLKELEHQLSNNRIVFYEWKEDNILHLILNTGLIIVICINVHSKDVYKIVFDKFLIGKLLSENICDVLSTKVHLIISYNENQLTLVTFNKPLTKSNLLEKLAKLEPKIQHLDLFGPTGRRLVRKLSCNKSGDSILTWWHSTRNEVFPWSPLVKDEDRANIHIYSLSGARMEMLCFYRTEFDLMNVTFSQIKPNVVWLIEQKVSKKGEITIEYSLYEIEKNVFKKISITSIPLQTQLCCHSISPDEERLVLGCMDGSLILFDEPRGITRLVKSALIPNLVSWHNDGALITIANERNQFQFFDSALSCVRTQLLSDDEAPSNLLDLAPYFKTQPLLLHMMWNKKANAAFYADGFIPSDHLLLLIFENGPLGVINLIGGGGLTSDLQNSGLTPDTIIRQYLSWNQSDKALNVLLSLNWNTNGPACLAGLYHIANHIFRHPFTPEGEVQLEAALGSFYAPIRPLTRFTENEFGSQVHDLTRRFFHLLLRHQLYEKAYCLAIDLSNADLFIDLYHCAKLLENEEMAFACRAKIEKPYCASESSSHSSSSRSSCSCTDSYTENEEIGVLPPLPQVSVKKSKVSRVPPLPDLNRHNKLRESAFFNCHPTYLQFEPERRNGFDTQPTSPSFKEYYPGFPNSLPKTPDCSFSSTQILTPEFPHSCEIRTSFSTQENIISSFTSSSQNFKIPKDSNIFQFRPNVIESLYDLPSNLALVRNEPKRDFPSYRPSSSINSVGPLKLKSFQNQFKVSNSSCPSKALYFDYLPPAALRTGFSGNKPIINPLNFNPQYQISKSPPSKSFSHAPPKHFNNLMLQRPLHFVPNSFPKHFVKQVNPAAAKQKVKFSDTVTQIVVPDLSNMSIADEIRTSKLKSRSSQTPKASVLPPGYSCNFPQSKGVTNSGEEFSQQQEQEEEENNGTIKVIHFGVV